MAEVVPWIFAVTTALAFVLCIVATVDPNWRVSDPSSLISEDAYRFEGLWVECDVATGGQWTCDDFDSFFLGLPAHVQAGRAFMITACLLFFITTIIAILTIPALPCASGNTKTRNKARMVACGLNVFAGLCVLVAVSWYMQVTVHEYYLMENIINGYGSQTRYEQLVFGASIFIGLVSTFLSITAAIIGCCISCKSDDNDEYRSYTNHMNVQRKPQQQYV